jgi:molybdate transport system substrate-binding protein
MQRRVFAFGSAAIAAMPRLVRAEPPEPLIVFAAASLTDVLKSLGEQWTARTGQVVRFSFAASSTLARQIAQGAPADIFASADAEWMDDLQRRGMIVDASRTSPIGNTLVLIAPRPANGAAPRPVALSRQTDLAALLGPDGRLATGDPAHVPAGLYARQALTWMGQWDAVAPRIARADSVRAALLLVERGEAPLGIVYGTDAAVAPGVAVVGVFPAESHAPVLYPFAVLRRAAADPRTLALFAFLTGADAAATYRRLGFSGGRP